MTVVVGASVLREAGATPCHRKGLVRTVLPGSALLHDAICSQPERSNVGLRNAVTIGHSEMSHSVQDRTRKRSLRLLRWHRAAAHRAANDRFVSRHRRLHQAASCVARFMRPSSAATGINGSDGRVALTRCVGPALSLRILLG